METWAIAACGTTTSATVRSPSAQRRNLLRGWCERIAANSLTEGRRDVPRSVRTGAALDELACSPPDHHTEGQSHRDHGESRGRQRKRGWGERYGLAYGPPPRSSRPFRGR